MSKLLRASLSRMLHTKVFWILNILFALGAMGISYLVTTNASVQTDGSPVLSEIPKDVTLYLGMAVMGIALAIFCSLFVGTEYSDGTIRNKLVIGHTRVSVYLSNWIVCVIAGICFLLAYMLPCVAIAWPLFGQQQRTNKQLLMLLVLSVCIVMAYTAIYVFIAMLNSSKAGTAVTSLVLSFVLWFAATAIYSRLQEPEYYEAYSVTIDGETHAEERRKNTNYLEGSKRKAYETLNDLLPGCQASRVAGMYEPEPTWCFAWYALALTTLLTVGGLTLFWRKDIK